MAEIGGEDLGLYLTTLLPPKGATYLLKITLFLLLLLLLLGVCWTNNENKLSIIDDSGFPINTGAGDRVSLPVQITEIHRSRVGICSSWTLVK